MSNGKKHRPFFLILFDLRCLPSSERLNNLLDEKGCDCVVLECALKNKKKSIETFGPFYWK